MAGNTTYLTPEPTVAVTDPSLLAFSDKLDEVSAAEVALQTLRAERDALRVDLEKNLNGRGTYVDTAPGPWTQAKISGRSSATITGLTSGMKYAFRIRALGPNELESPWSDEVICMAP